MRICVLTCRRYSDAWVPFFRLFRKFWPNCPYPVWLVTDSITNTPPIDNGHFPHLIHLSPEPTWNRILADFAGAYDDEPIMLFLEDYFLTATPHQHLIDHAEGQYYRHSAACVRLYPCPGGITDYGDPYFAIVPPHTPYRVSTQVAIWNPEILGKLAITTDSPQSFELDGSKRYTGGPILAFKRDVTSWPLEYICTAIVRGVWQKGALEHCSKHGIPVDTTQRPVQS